MTKVAIQRARGGFDERWIDYCEANKIEYKLVDCYQNDIIDQLRDCEGLMWQYYHNHPKDMLMAKELLFSLEHAGLSVFPDFNSAWHFDDKLGQKYLLELINAPLVSTWIFYDQQEALDWVKSVSFPIVFKLRGGAGSENVRLVNSKRKALRIIRKAFNWGFPQYDPIESIKERWRLFRNGKSSFIEVLEGFIRFILPPKYSNIKGRERGYVYFQQYLSGKDHDIRVVVIGDKALAIKRMVRENDFRASGSGKILYDKDLFNENTINLAFKISEKLNSQCVAFDFISDANKDYLVEISYGFSPMGYDPCPGYWSKDLSWHEGKFNPYGWMVENLLSSISERKSRRKKP